MRKFDGVLILTDMDGTYLSPDSSISAENGEAVKYFMAQGGLFGVATGRAKRSVEGFLPALVTNAPSIVHNGALLVHLGSGEILRQVNIGHSGEELVREILEKFPHIGVEICLPDTQYVANFSDISERHHKKVGLEMHLSNYKDVPQPWLKLNLAGEHEQLLQVQEHFERDYGSRLFGQFSMPHYFEVMAQNSSKGDSAAYIRDTLGIAAENFYTVGDGLNDRELLQTSGANSYAPGNAHPSILGLAKHILPPNDSHAICALIEQLDKKY